MHSDVISGVVVEQAGVKVCVKIGDFGSNRCRDIRLPHFVTNNDNEDDAGRLTLDNGAKRLMAFRLKCCFRQLSFYKTFKLHLQGVAGNKIKSLKGN